tara:strand:+ start:342 stop:569 length:228 start_codon:yes stop_codon:yes gene_type:complete
MIDRKLKERVKFKQSIDRLNKCSLQKNGSIRIPHDIDPFPFEYIYNELLGKVIFCKICKAIIFKGNKKWKNLLHH